MGFSSTSRFRATDAKIAKLARQIVELFQPERIILFGSRARGAARADSDVDLLVVMPYEGSSIHQAQRVRQSVDYHFPLDLIVRSPEEIERRLRLGDFFLQDVLREGQVLYEHADG